jgi:hypothetical protein
MNDNIRKTLPIPIMAAGFKNKGYDKLAANVWSLAKNVQYKLNLPCPSFCPFEALMFHYLVEMVQNPFDLTVHACDMYKVLSYHGRVNSTHTEKFECECVPSPDSPDVDEMVAQSIQSHHETVSKVELMMKIFLSDEVTASSNANLSFKKNKIFKLFDNEEVGRRSIVLEWKYDYFAVNEPSKEAVCVYISPQMTKLNYDELLKRILIDRCLLTILHKGDVRIFVYILTLDHRFPILVEFNETSSTEMAALLREYTKKIYEEYNENVFKHVDLLMDKRWREVKENIRANFKEYPYYIDVYFDNKLEEEDEYVPKRELDKAVLDKRIHKKINDMFPIN